MSAFPLICRQLALLEEEVCQAAGRAADPPTQMHLEGAAARIEAVLSDEKA